MSNEASSDVSSDYAGGDRFLGTSPIRYRLNRSLTLQPKRVVPTQSLPPPTSFRTCWVPHPQVRFYCHLPASCDHFDASRTRSSTQVPSFALYLPSERYIWAAYLHYSTVSHGSRLILDARRSLLNTDFDPLHSPLHCK